MLSECLDRESQAAYWAQPGVCRRSGAELAAMRRVGIKVNEGSTPRTDPDYWRERGKQFQASLLKKPPVKPHTALAGVVEGLRSIGLEAEYDLDGLSAVAHCPIHTPGLLDLTVREGAVALYCRKGCTHQQVIERLEQKVKAQPPMDDDLETRDTLHDALVEERLSFYRADRAAKQRLMVDAWREPPFSSSLEIDLALPVDPVRYRILGMLGVNHNASLTAQYKTGKTTLLCGLVKSLADGNDFLGSIEVEPPQGRIGFWNAEMDRDDYIGYIRSTGIQNPTRVETAHLRGFNVPILSEQGRNWAVRWLRDQGVTVWINDAWSRLCAWSGVDENDNTEINRLCAAIDEIKSRAGVSEFITTHHTGRKQHEMGAEHGRGAASLDAWVDSRWVMTREGAARFLMVEGRKMGLAGGTRELVFDPETGLNNLGSKDRSTARSEQHNDVVERLVTANPGIKTTDLLVKVQDAIPGKNRTAANTALKAARESGVVYTAPGARNSQRYFPRGHHDEQ